MEDIFTFLFQTRTGFAVLFVLCVVISVIVAIVLERRTHTLYVDRGANRTTRTTGFCKTMSSGGARSLRPSCGSLRPARAHAA